MINYGNWSKEQQQFFKEAMNSSGRGKEMEKMIKIQKLIYRYNNGGSFKDESGKKIYYPAGSPNWKPYNGM